MSDTPKPPIITKSEGDVLVFRDVPTAEAYVEHYDVADGLYDLVFDSLGRRLEFVVDRGPRFGRGPFVRLVMPEASVVHPDDLKGLLREALEHDDADDRSLPELIAEAAVRFAQE